MKFLQKTMSALVLMVMVQMAQAQYCGSPAFDPPYTGSGSNICQAGTNLTQPGFSPPADSVPCAIQGVYVDDTVQVKVPTTVYVSPFGNVTLTSITIDTVSNLPCGLCWATENANNKFSGGSQFCMRVRGTTYDNPGQYDLHIIVTGVALGISETENAASAGLKFEVRVQTPTGTCVPVDTNSPGIVASGYGPAPSSAVSAGGSLSFCQGGSVVLTATQATATSYQWYNNNVLITGATSRTYTATASGSYTVDIVANCIGVTSTAEVVTVNTPPTASVAPAGPIIICTGNTQLLTATVSGGTQQWYNATTLISGQTGTTYTAAATGTYYVIATQNGCTDTSNKVSVQVSGTPPTPTITATKDSACAGVGDTLNAGAGYTTYAWSNSLGANQKAYPTAPGTYSVTVTNGVCSGSASITINTIAATPTPTITESNGTTICQGTTTTLTSSTADSYLWSTGARTRSIIADSAATYYVTTNNGCGPATSGNVVISVTARPSASVTPVGPIVLCGSGTQLLTATGGGTYQWLNNNAVIAGQTTSTYTAATTGNYSCQVTKNGCTDTSNVVNVQITSNNLNPVITATRSFVCPTGADTLNVGSGYTSYLWSPGGATTGLISITSSGTYDVTVHNGACSGTATINIASQPATPTPTITANGNTTFCQGGSVILSSSSSSSYLWNNGGGTHDSTTVTISGSYTVTTNNGCGAATSLPTVITVNSIPNAAITPSGSTLICGGSSQPIIASPAGAFYTWLDHDSVLFGSNDDTLYAAATGAYQVVVTVNGCSDTSNTATIQVSGTPPTPTITATTLQLCPSSGPDTLNVGAGYSSYTWNGGLGTGAYIIVNSGGTYSVTVANGVCVGSASVTVNQGTATPTPTITASGPLQICGSGSVTLTSSAPSGNVWSTTATTNSIMVSASGIYTVTNTGACGSAISAPDTVAVIALPALVVLPNDTSICGSGSVVFTASTNGAAITWSEGLSGTSTDTVSTSGPLLVTATANGCSTVDTAALIIIPIPNATFTVSHDTLYATPGGTAYQWYDNSNIITGADSPTYVATITGNYSVEIADGPCSATSPAQLVTVLGLTDISRSITTLIAPNPTNGQVTISYTLLNGEDLDLTLTDVTGRTVSHLYSGSQASGTYHVTTDMSALAAGVYMVNFRTTEGTLVRKVVKE